MGSFSKVFDPAKSWFLRVELALGKLLLSVSEDGIGYKNLRTLDLTSVPKGIRIGKTDQKGNTSEQSNSKSTGRCRIEQLTLLGGPQNPGADLDFLNGLVVKVHYELYDGLPLLSKWVTVETPSTEGFVLNNIKTEHLAVTEAESAVEGKQRWELPPIFAQSDFAFQSMSPNASENACVEWQEGCDVPHAGQLQPENPFGIGLPATQRGLDKRSFAVSRSKACGCGSYSTTPGIGNGGDWRSGKCTAQLRPG
jgi:hypothetical protein